MVSRQIINEAARAAKRGGQPAWVKRPTSLQLYQGTVGRVDTFNGIVDFETNDPSGLVIPSVRYIQAYSPNNVPQVGHTVWMGHFDTQMVIFGQHVVPNSIVIP